MMNEKGVSMVGLVLYINNVIIQKRDIIRFQINPILSCLIECVLFLFCLYNDAKGVHHREKVAKLWIFSVQGGLNPIP